MITKYQDYLIRDFDTAENGNKAVGVNVWIYEAGTSVLAALKDEYNNPIANPVTTDKNGYYSFYINPNYYDFKTDVGTDRERFLFENVNIDFTDAFDIVVIKNPTSNVLPIPYKITKEQVELNGSVLPPDSGFYEVDNDALTITISSDLNSDDIVVLRFSPLSNVDAPVGYGGVLDARVSDANADISPIVKQMYNDGFKTIYIYGNYFIKRAIFDTIYSDLEIISHGKLKIHPDVTAVPDAEISDNVLWMFSGENQKLTYLTIDVDDVRGITGLDLNGAINPELNFVTVMNGGTSASLPKYCSAISFRGTKGGRSMGVKTQNFLNGDLTGSDSRGITVDGSAANPTEDHNFYYCEFEDNTSCMIAGYAKNCHFIGGSMRRNNLTNTSSTKNGFYFVAFDADYQGGGCSISGYEFKRVQQPFVTRVSNVTFVDSVCVDCNIHIGFDNSASPTVPIEDVVIDNIKVRMTDDVSSLSGGFLRTRFNNALVKNCTIKNCDIITNVIYGGFLYCDIGNGRLDGCLFEGNTFMFMLKDPQVQTNLRVGVFVDGTDNTFKNNGFRALNRTGSALSETLTMEMVFPEEGGNDWIDNILSSDDPDLYIRAFNVFNGDSHVQDTNNVLLGDIGGGVLQNKKFGSPAGRIVAANSGKFPRSGSWNTGDIVKRDAIVTKPSNWFPSDADGSWECIKGGDFSDSDVNNWPIWCVNGEPSKQRVTIAPPTLIQPSAPAKGVDVLVQIDPTIKSYPVVPINTVVYELYEKVSGSFSLVESRTSNNDRELFTGLTDGSEYRINVIGRSAFYIDQGVPVGYDFTVSSSEPSDTLGTPVSITSSDPYIEANYDVRSRGVRLVTVNDYTIDVLDSADSDLDKDIVFSLPAGGTFRLNNDASHGAELKGWSLGGAWTIDVSGASLSGPAQIPQGYSFTAKKGAGIWYVRIENLSYTEPVTGTFNDGDTNPVSVTDGLITNFGV